MVKTTPTFPRKHAWTGRKKIFKAHHLPTSPNIQYSDKLEEAFYSSIYPPVTSRDPPMEDEIDIWASIKLNEISNSHEKGEILKQRWISFLQAFP